MGSSVSQRYIQPDNIRGENASSSDFQNFPNFIINGKVENVKRAISKGYCDVNTEIYHDGKLERPLSVAIKNIQEENDRFFQIAQTLLKSRFVDINANIFSFDLNLTSQTILPSSLRT